MKTCVWSFMFNIKPNVAMKTWRLRNEVKRRSMPWNEDGNPYAPSWYTLNVKASYGFDNGMTFTCGLENLTDQRYRPYSSGLSAAGRNFIVALSARF